MNSKIPLPLGSSGIGWLPLLAFTLSGNAWGDVNDPKDPTIYFPCDNPRSISYAGKANSPAGSINESFGIGGVSPAEEVTWRGEASSPCTGSMSNFECHNIKVTLPSGPVSSESSKAFLSNDTALGGIKAQGELKVTVTLPPPIEGAPTPPCDQHFFFRITANGGGFGDPHILTVDGVHYDFQSAGEFIALRGKDQGKDMEIQTRQTPIATTFLPGANPYTGLASCVSIYSAVAARVGTHTVSYQPNISGVPDPSGMQLWVDGELTTLDYKGIDLDKGGDGGGGDGDGGVILSPTRDNSAESPLAGRIGQSPVGKGIEIHYADGTKLVATPNYWQDQQKWLLDIGIYDTTASEGIMGKLAQDSWLPALPDGTSLGPKQESLHDRYVALNERFADAWRVKQSESLFKYKPGTSTATFTLREWPRENPTSCALEGEPSAKPLNKRVAEKLCAAITDKNLKEDCIFDVSVTGNPDFAQTHKLTEQLEPGLTLTTMKDDKDPTAQGENVTFTATVAQKLRRAGSTPGGAAQFILDGRNAGDPVALDSNGHAAWSTSSLSVGKHKVVAKYIPSGFGGSVFQASSSQEESHKVTKEHEYYLLCPACHESLPWD
jgi:hypothetical protein